MSSRKNKNKKRKNYSEITVRQTDINIAVNRDIVANCESRHFTIDFSYVNNEEFLLTGVKIYQVKKLIKFFKGICCSTRYSEFNDNVPMEIKRVKLQNEYKKIHDKFKLGDDVDMYECDIADVRLMFHIDGAEKVVYPLELVKHPEYKKNVR